MHTLVLHEFKLFNKSFKSDQYFSTVSGETFPDPRGRWRIGGGINVPIALETSSTEYKAMEIKRALTLNGLICSVKKS